VNRPLKQIARACLGQPDPIMLWHPIAEKRVSHRDHASPPESDTSSQTPRIAGL
jgi:hypothetical protein